MQIKMHAKGHYAYVLGGMIFMFLSLSASSLRNILTNQAESRPNNTYTDQQIKHRVTEYSIRANLFILGDLGALGKMAIEENVRKDANRLEKVFRMYGSTDPKHAKKGRDYSGDLKIITRLPLKPDESVDGMDAEQGGGVESCYSGVLKKNEKVEREEVIFYSDHAVSKREKGDPKIIQGKYASPLSAFEYFLENTVKEGDVFESNFIIDSSPKVYRCEVGKKEYLEHYKSYAYKIDVLTFDGMKKDEMGQPLAIKKKGGIRLWLCKEGEFKDRFLRLNIKYKWYLTLSFQMRIIRQTSQPIT